MATGRRARRRRRRFGFGWLILAAVFVLAAVGVLALWARQSGESRESVSSSAVSAAVETAGTETSQASELSAEAEVTPTPEASASPEVSATPEVTSAPAASATPEELLAEMSLREKLCQMIMTSPSRLTGVKTVVAAGETTKKALEQYPVGGLLYDKSNMQSKAQLLEMANNTQRYSKIPLFLTCDEEGGRVTRLMASVGTTRVDAMLTYKDQGTEKARSNAATLGSDLASCGLNLDLAPVADVWSNPENTVIGDRAYSDDFDQAAQLIPAAVAGFHDARVGCVLKHFPGHGSTTADSHYGSAYVNKTLEQLRQEDLLPFQAGIDAGADMVMMGHLIVPDVDDQPAVLSHDIVTGLLREELGFDGVIITDALEMGAITDHYGKNEVAVLAVKAGVDLLLSPLDLPGAVDALEDAVERGDIPESRIDQSVLRILRLKEKLGLL